jgi:hypothetical protein
MTYIKKYCSPFKHELSYVTDREDMVMCLKCFVQWNVEPNTRFESARMTFTELHKLRKLYR